MRRASAVSAGLRGVKLLVLRAAGACALAALAFAPPGAAAPPAGEPAAAPGTTAPAASQPTAPAQAPAAASQPSFAWRTRIAIFRLSHADATRAAQIMQQLLGPDAIAVADARTNSVIVSADAVAIEKAKRVFAALDVPLTPTSVTVEVVTRPAATRLADTRPTATRPSTGPASRPALHPASAPSKAPARGPG